MKLLIMSSLVFGIACGDDDTLPTVDAGMVDGSLPDVPVLDVVMIDGGDPCTGVAPADRCGTAGTTCSGDTLTTCAENATGCLVSTEADCSADGGSCDDSGAVAMCSSDPCMGITNCMPDDPRTCAGDTLTICETDAMGCSVSADTDCADDGTICDDTGAMAVCVNPCDGISDCDTEGRSCDGDTLNVCAPDAAGCLVNSPTECAGEGAMCDDSVDPIACVPTSCPAATVFAMALDCDSGTVSGNTMGGTSNLNANCGFTGYTSPENVFTFEDARSATVTITATRTAGTGDADILVLEGGAAGVNACGEASCLDSSRGTGDEEEVEFDLLAGDVAYVAYDIWSTGGYICEEDAAGLSTCELSCGDSEVNGEDQCDDGGTAAGDGCSDTCEIETGYFCEEDAAGLSTCELSCGDGVINGEDECDDMNDTDADGCTACVVDMGYSCSSAPSVCALTCGDGDFDADLGEFCDDGNADNGDGCAMDCTVEAGFACANDDGEISICGAEGTRLDGVLEDTDTEWARPSATCGTSTTDTVFEAVEYTNSTGAEQTVDILTNYAFDGYSYVFSDIVDPADPTTNCVVGNDDFTDLNSGILQDIVIADGETIQIVISSFSATTNNRGEFSVFVLDAGFGCGNGLTDVPGDDCDDGNNTDGDGCSALCATEMDFICVDEPSVCEMPICGNSMIEIGEVCDDGNTDPDDGCEADCASAVFTGTLDDTTTYDRLDAVCSTAGTTRDGVSYNTVPFTWNGAAEASLRFDVVDGYDGYVHAYSDPFDATMPMVGCLAGNDDGGPGSRMTVDMTAGQAIDVVLSTYNAGVGGDWELTVTLAP